MNSSLRRTCTERGRMVHVSKPWVIEWVRKPQPFVDSVMFVDTQGVATQKWPTVVLGKGDTFKAGIQNLKRADAPSDMVRRLKEAAWSAARGD